MLIGHDFAMDDEAANPTEGAGPPGPAPAAPRPPDRGPDPLARKVAGYLEARSLRLDGRLRQQDRDRRAPGGTVGPEPAGSAPVGIEPEAELTPAEPRDVPPGPDAPGGKEGAGVVFEPTGSQLIPPASDIQPQSSPSRDTADDPGSGPSAIRDRPPAIPGTRGQVGPADVRPMVVIQRRGSGLLRGLIPPALVLAAAGAILAFRVREPDWSGLTADPPRMTTGADPSAVLANSSPLAPPGRVVARVKAETARERPEPTPAEPPADEPPLVAAPAVPAPAPDLPAPAIVPVEPTPLVADAGAFAEPPPLLKPIPKEEALRDIRREAARKVAEGDRNEDRQVRAAAREQAEARRRQAEQVRRSEHFVDEDRPIFLEELRRILRAGGPRTGVQIEDLCRQHKQVLPAAVEKAFKRAQLAVAARLNRRKRVELYRKLGLPEPRILYELANDELANVGMRQGPRNRMEALVVASRRLLEIPPPGPEPVAGAGMPPGTAPANGPR